MQHIAKIIIDLSLDKTFDYNIPAVLSGKVKIGSRVNVPFGRGERQGYVLAIGTHTDFPRELKDILSMCEGHSRIPQKLVKLGEWMADYYCCSREQAIRTLLPRAVRSGKIKHKTMPFYAVADPAEAEIFVAENHERKALHAQLEMLKLLLNHQDMSREQLLNENNVSVSTINTLKKKGLVIEEKRHIARDPFHDVQIIADKDQKPTPEQGVALEKLAEMIDQPEGRRTALLFGITGSGKTEVYLQCISRILDKGQDAIVLVPEISLTPQTVRRFRARFGDMVSVMHSRLTEGERFDEWNKISDGKVRIVVGARSALFAPFRNLGLIIVDEEHENSYKQGEAPRYHARDVAVMRGHMENAVVILGSATPSFESYHNALSGKYELIRLTKRVDKCVLPIMKVIDVRLDKSSGDDKKSSFFTKMLYEAVNDRLWRGEQTILFLNRRGYARQMMCDNCGYVAECSECSVAYTYHQHNETLTCHMCGDSIKAHTRCPDCQSEEIKYSGIGTEKVESVAKKIFKHARIARMDSDTMKTAAAYEHVLNEFKRGNIDILIGTQMIAKGLHFPNVTLVGIINADQSLHIPDFRAPERTFQLITQVAGRAGRGDVKGEVLIQTFTPFNETIQSALKHDFNGFYESDMEVRKMLMYPPAGHLMTVHFQGEELNEVSTYATQFMEYLRPACHEKITISEPAPAPVERVKSKYRYIIILRGEKTTQLRRFIRHYILNAKHPKGVHVYADVDAQSLM